MSNDNNNPNYYNINQPGPYNNDATVSPIGLDFKGYLNNENSTNNDGPIIDEALEDNNNFLRIMQKRDKDLKNLTANWQRGNKSDVIQQIVSMNDIGIVNAFVLYAIIKTELKRIDITCSDANSLFPALIQLVESKNEQHFLNGVLSSWVLLRMFEEVITTTKQSQFMGAGIDLNKEDKIRKYDKFINYISQIRNSNNFTAYFNKNTKLSGVDLNKYANEVDYFLRKCSK